MWFNKYRWLYTLINWWSHTHALVHDMMWVTCNQPYVRNSTCLEHLQCMYMYVYLTWTVWYRRLILVQCIYSSQFYTSTCNIHKHTYYCYTYIHVVITRSELASLAHSFYLCMIDSDRFALVLTRKSEIIAQDNDSGAHGSARTCGSPYGHLMHIRTDHVTH